jgi:thiosulfate dehydrogenase (quinone) large subunit
MPTESGSWKADLRRAYALLRLTLGLNICMHGVVRWAAGLDSFAHSLLPMFQKTPLPAWSVYGFGVALPVLETVIGAALAVGFRTRASLFAGALLMLALTFGSALRQDWPTVGIQLTYSFVYCVLIAGAHFDGYCLDRLLNHRG